MKPTPRTFLFVLVMAISVVGCSGQQEVDRATPAAAEPNTPAPAAEPVATASTLRVVHWGPQSTPAGTAFNAQADGQSALFVELSEDAPASPIELSFAGKPLIDVVSNGKIVTVTVPIAYLQVPGSYAIELSVPEQDLRIPVGSFVVNDEATAASSD